MLDYKLGIEDFNSYLPVEYYYAYAVLRRLQPAATDVICDVGCGKGRFLCIAARYPVRRVLGIELQRELCAAARENLVRLRGRRAPAEVICANCTELDFPDDVTIVFMFNPFGTETMISFLGRIGTSLRRKPRCFQIVYYNDRCAEVLAERGWLHQDGVLRTAFGGRISFWSHAESSSGQNSQT